MQCFIALVMSKMITALRSHKKPGFLLQHIGCFSCELRCTLLRLPWSTCLCFTFRSHSYWF